MVATSIGTRLRAAMTEQGWSYTKLIAAMRRVAAAERDSLPETRSLVTTISRWCNDHERPSEFYQDILCKALRKSRPQLGFGDGSPPEDEGGSEPEDLARVLEASNVGPLAIAQIEAKLTRRGETNYPTLRLRCSAVRCWTTIGESRPGSTDHSRLLNVVGSTRLLLSWPGWLGPCPSTCMTPSRPRRTTTSLEGRRRGW
jgi:hypothetical protein